MVVGEIAESIDLLVIGGGPGGYTAALRAAALGRDVTLVDTLGEEGLGGVCLRVGCIPSKALIEVADIRHRAAEFASAGLVADIGAFDLEAWQGWKAGVVSTLTGGVAGLLRQAKVSVLRGRFRFLGPQRGVLDAGGSAPPRFLEFRDAIIATGSAPRQLPHLPRDGARVLDSTDALALERVPRSLVVVGGGYIGLELGTAYAKLGAAVTIVEASSALLPGMPAEVVSPVRKRLTALGVDVRLDTRVASLTDSSAVLEGASAGEIEAEVVVVAIGRHPNTADLGLADAGVSVRPDGLIEVGADRRATSHIAAIGDVTPGPALAHKATAEASVAAEALSGDAAAAFDPATIPMVVFSDPEIAVAGEVEREGASLRSRRRPFSANGRALTTGESAGFLRLSVEETTGAVVGVHIVGPHASELISEGVLAIEMGASPADIALSIHPHPTLSEQLAEAAAELTDL
jgi:dihydrolipoamide dehydrogenase